MVGAQRNESELSEVTRNATPEKYRSRYRVQCRLVRQGTVSHRQTSTRVQVTEVEGRCESSSVKERVFASVEG